jgi:peptide/nickel transport system permease protein
MADPGGRRTRVLRRPGRERRGSGKVLAGVIILGLVVACAIVVPLVSPFSATEILPAQALRGPSLSHLLGTDNLGRDVLVRVMAGYQISLVVAVGSTLVAVAIGLPLGLLAGYFPRYLDNLIMRPLDVLMAFPAILLGVTIIAFAGTGTDVLVAAIGVVYTPVIARVSRSTTIAVRTAPFIDVTIARGASHARVLIRHVLPNSLGPVIVQASLLMGFAILLESAFSYVGLGVQPPTPTLGSMLASGQDFMLHAPWIVLAPGIAIMVAVLGFNLIGDGLRDSLDPGGRVTSR